MSRIVINVTLDGNRLFSTSRTAAIGTCNVESVVKGLQTGFPEAEGYKVEAFVINTTHDVKPLHFGTTASTDESSPTHDEFGVSIG